MKQCIKCKEIKPKNKFHKQTKNFDGLQIYCKNCRSGYYKENKSTISKKESNYYETIHGRSKALFVSAKHRAFEKNREITITREWIAEKLNNGVCELSGLLFDFKRDSRTHKNPYSPSLDRIDSSLGYTETNTRLVLTAINEALNQYGEKTMLPILEALVKGIKKNVKKKSVARVSKQNNKKS